MTALGLALFVCAGLVAFDYASRLTQMEQAVNHTQAVIADLNALRVTVEDLQRGAVSDNGKSRLGPCQVAERTTTEMLDRVQELTADNLDEMISLQSLRRQVREHIKQTEARLGAKPSDQVRADDEHKSLVDNICRRIEALQKQAELGLTRRSAILTQVSEDLRGLLAFIALAIIATSALVVWTGRRESQRKARQEARYQIAKILSETEDLSTCLGQCLLTICNLLDWKVGIFWSNAHVGEALQCVVTHCQGEQSDEPIVAASRDLSLYCGMDLPGTAWASREATWIADIALSTNFTRADAAQASGLSSAIALPILSGEQVVGVAEFFASRARRPDEELLELLRSLGAQIGHYMERQRYRQELTDGAHLAIFTSEISGIIARREDLDEMLRGCTDLIVAHLNAAFSGIWMVSELKDSLTLAASSRMYINVDDELKTIGIDESDVVGAIAFGCRSFTSNSVSTDARFAAALWVQSEGIVSFAGFPLMVGDELVGVLALYGRKPMTDWTFNVLGNVADNIAVGIKRKTEEEVLRSTEARTRLIVEKAHDAFVGVHSQGSITDWNAQAETIFGWSAAEAIGQNLQDLIVPDRHRSESVLPMPSAVGEPGAAAQERMELSLLRRDRSEFPAELTVFPIQVSGETIYCAFIRDITQRLEAQRRINEFYSTVSHELRTPLTSIRASLGLMEGGRAGDLSSRATQLVHIARTESDRLIRLINDMLDLRKIEAGKLELKPQTWDAGDLVNAVVDGIKGMSEAASVAIRTEVDPGIKLFCDRDRFIQVLTNLVSNAVQLSPKDSVVTVCVAKHGGQRARFAVIDAGPGIQASDLPKLFGKFQQLDSSDSRSKGGTGLGLAISKAIVEQHGCTIGVESVVGTGSTFWFDMPLRKTQDDIELVPPACLPAVLLIESDDRLAGEIEAALGTERQSLVRATTLATAGKIMEEVSPAAIIVDIEQSERPGAELLEKLRAGLKEEDVPMIVLGGAADNFAATNSYVFEWLTKPFELQALAAVLRFAIRGSKERPLTALIVEDDQVTREMLVEQLTPLGLHCIQSGDGQEALALVPDNRPDLIVLDIGLPHVDGFEFVGKIRGQSARTTPLIVYTSRDLSREERTSLTLGPTRHLIKSQTSEGEFIAAVRHLLKGLMDESVEDTNGETTTTSKTQDQDQESTAAR